MQGLLIPLSFAIWIGVWILIVKKRGRLGKVSGNLIGGLVGLIVATVFLRALIPELAPEEKATAARSVASPVVAQAPSQQKPSVPAEAIDKITLLYLKHKVYPNDPTVCEAERIGGRDMVGCRAQGWGGNSQVHVWEYSQGKFKSINGSARSLAETKFSNESAVEVSPLPLPSDIKVDEVVKVFAKG
ncbi:hypothetical protein CYD26_21120 [Pseudomonas sp. FFUP_PS_473]|uniref:hypothetical protein n=1 Tax=Pseudomonas sp. FFUP_PS_473 TaxID=2060418 RepID=UPI000C7BFF36|nr:hypothetical protein [Pseudomonas sp. FFUP_PS_473]PLP87629.1 hypothetical protein CYD26_21120 [Pseudomonas sp. FFUP_PS_473]